MIEYINGTENGKISSILTVSEKNEKRDKPVNPYRIEYDIDMSGLIKKVNEKAYDEVIEVLTKDIQNSIRKVALNERCYYRQNPSYESALKDLVSDRIKSTVKDAVDEIVKESKDEIIEKTADKLALRLAKTKAAKELFDYIS